MTEADGPHGPESLPTLRAELRERSKELGYLHQATRLINTRGEPRDILRGVLELLPSAMYYPELAGARLCLGPLELRTRGYEQSELSLRADFSLEGGGDGFVEVCYAPAPPTLPAFLEEEQSLLGSLAELLRGHFELMRAETDYQRLMLADAEQQSALSENRATEQFLSTVSHELRASLDVMLGWVQVLKQGTADPARTARGLQIVEHNILLQSKLVTALLDPSCVDASKLQLDLAELDLAELVGWALDGQRPAAEAKQLDLSAQLGRVGSVRGDQRRLERAVHEVLANAVQFTPGGGSIRVVLDQDGSDARLVVTDTGIGIAPELVPLVGSPRAGGASPDSPGKSPGLGLSIARQSIEAHGGTLSVQSRRRAPGTTIEIRLPLRAHDAPAR